MEVVRRTGGHASHDRADSPRVIRPPGGVSFLSPTRRGQRRGRAQRCVSSGTQVLAARRSAPKSGGLAVDDGAACAHRCYPSSDSGPSERTDSAASQGKFHGGDLVDRISGRAAQIALRMCSSGNRSRNAHR